MLSAVTVDDNEAEAIASNDDESVDNVVHVDSEAVYRQAVAIDDDESAASVGPVVHIDNEAQANRAVLSSLLATCQRGWLRGDRIDDERTRHESMTALVGTVVHVDHEGLRPSTTTRALRWHCRLYVDSEADRAVCRHC